MAAQRPPQRGTFEGRTAGTYRYPEDPERYADNAADLLELRLAASPDSVYGLIRLNTLRAPDTTVAAVALDTDGDLGDTAGIWPFGAGLRTPGADVVITAWGTGGQLTDLTTGESHPIQVAANPANEHNAIEFAVDRRLLPGETWTIWAATGLWDGDAHEWMVVPAGPPTASRPGYGDPGLPRAFNVAFRETEEGGYYENRQAAALAAGDVTSFAGVVRVGALDERLTERAELPVGRPVEIVVDEELTIGPLHEGTSYAGGVPGRHGGAGGVLSQEFEYFGPHQPYTLRLPSDWRPGREWPLVFALHGLGGTHGGWVTRESFVQQVLEAPGFDSLILVAPLARGSSFYADYGELDALATLADAEPRLWVDSDRRYLLGYSMGGYGVYRFATTRPDMWAAAATYAGYTGEYVGNYAPRYSDVVDGDPGGVEDTFQELTGLGGGRAGRAPTGNPVDLLANLREVPILHAAGSNDEIVPVTGQYRAAQVLDELDYRHRFDLYPGYEHLSFALLDNWAGVRQFFGDRVRTSRPRRVTYGFSPAWADPALDLDIRYDSAWWISGLQRREGHDDPVLDTHTYGWVDVESHAVPEPSYSAEPIRELSVSSWPHLRIGDQWMPTGTREVSNRLTATLRNVAALTVDTAGAGLVPGSLVVEIRTDGPAEVTLEGSFRGRPSRTEGPVRVTRTPRGVKITVLEAAEVVVGW